MKDLDGIAFELAEASEHLMKLAEEIRNGKIGEEDDPALDVNLGHVLDHICYAWNARDLTGDEKYKLSQAEYEDLTNLVPNFQGNRKLKEGSY